MRALIPAVRPRLIRLVIRGGMTLAHRARQLHWRVSRRPIRGVRAMVLTPGGDIVLVRHSYTRGWHLPGGGRRRGENAGAAIRRELREEIGFRSGALELVDDRESLLGRRPHRLSTYVVRDAAYTPRRSLEIEEIGAFALAALPPDTAAATLRAIGAYLKDGRRS